MTDIFISYSNADKAFAEDLYRQLRRFNVRGFMDSIDIAAGASLSRQVRDAIEHSDAIVVVLPKSATRSNWVLAEMGIAESFGKAVIPVLAPGESYEESVPPLLVDRVVLHGQQGVEETAARIVATATGTSVEVASQELEARIRRRQRRLVVLSAVFGLLSLLSGMMAAYAYRQRTVAEESLDRLRHITNASAALAVSPNSENPLIATGTSEGTIIVADSRTGREVVRLERGGGAVTAVAFSPDGSLLASAGWDGEIEIWDLTSGILVARLGGNIDGVLAVAFSADGTQIIARSLDGPIQGWEVPDR